MNELLLKDNIPLKTSIDVARIRRSCRVVEDTLAFLADIVREGVTTANIDRSAEEFILQRGGRPALKGYRGFPSSICISVNNTAAHGIPDQNQLEDGDIVSVDTTIEVNGWYGDGAWTYIVGKGSADAQRLLRAAWQSNLAGIMNAQAGGKLGDIGEAISSTANRFGCSVIQDYVGHGIGRNLHEDPLVPNFGEKGQGEKIAAGMVFTVEPIVCLGEKDVRVLDDGWTVVTADGSLSAQFENTVAVFSNRLEVLTFSSSQMTDFLDEPPFFLNRRRSSRRL